MKLTFSMNSTLDAGDYFSIMVPSSNVAAQYIGGTQTLLKTEHFYASSAAQYLPTGTWYVFAEINDDRAISETNYDNNVITSSNQITVGPYKVNFITPPVATEITENSFAIEATFSAPITTIYYRHQPSGIAPPEANEIMSSGICIPGNLRLYSRDLALRFNMMCTA